MPLLNRASELQSEATEWRRHLHANPEILYDVENTAAFVAARLQEFGVDEIVTGIGRTGVVGIIKGSGEGSTIGLRADMDALPLEEITRKPWASVTSGRMHACGHDGHTAMLLGAAKYLAETRNFRGSIAVIFQPAEEGGGGAREMVADGMMEDFGIRQVYGMHNHPGMAVGTFATRKGSIMAAADQFDIEITGRSGHAAQPHKSVDPVLAASQVVVALQSIASREADPLSSVVVTVTKIHGGDAYNVIPDMVKLSGTVRTLLPEMREMAETRIGEIASGVAMAMGAKATLRYHRGYPVTFNHASETEFAVDVMRKVAGDHAVSDAFPPTMGAEDFSYMLESRPGSFIFIGNGDTANLHNSAYDFNDEVIPYGISYWVTLAETALAA